MSYLQKTIFLKVSPKTKLQSFLHKNSYIVNNQMKISPLPPPINKPISSWVENVCLVSALPSLHGKNTKTKSSEKV